MFWFWRTWLFERSEQKKVEKQFYSHKRFCAIDQRLLQLYRNKSPYAISKDFLRDRGAKDLYLYGETPLTTLYQMAVSFELKKEDCLIELGAGRCRAAFFLAEVIGCRVIALEQVLHFVDVARELQSPNLTILEGDFFQIDLPQATAIYLYGSHLREEEIEHLANLFQKLPSHVKIFTVSYPLPGFEVVAQITGHFPWGKTEIYWNRKRIEEVLD